MWTLVNVDRNNNCSSFSNCVLENYVPVMQNFNNNLTLESITLNQIWFHFTLPGVIKICWLPTPSFRCRPPGSPSRTTGGPRPLIKCYNKWWSFCFHRGLLLLSEDLVCWIHFLNVLKFQTQSTRSVIDVVALSKTHLNCHCESFFNFDGAD